MGGFPKDFIVRDARGEFGHVNDVMTLSPEPFHDGAIHTLVREQIHADRLFSG